jgi:hypothetical protein
MKIKIKAEMDLYDIDSLINYMFANEFNNQALRIIIRDILKAEIKLDKSEVIQRRVRDKLVTNQRINDYFDCLLLPQY